MKIIKTKILGFHCYNHSKNSGYDKLAYFGNSEYFNADTWRISRINFDSPLRWIFNIAFEITSIIKSRNVNLVHFIYPELHFLFAPFFINKRVVKVGTLHLDLEWIKNVKSQRYRGIKLFLKRIRYKSLSKLDGIIVLSKDTLQDTKILFPNSEVVYIPHGIIDNSYYFRPINQIDSIDILIVGSNYRDINFIQGLLEKCLNESKNWKFHYIGANREIKSILSGFSNLKICPFLCEEEYLEKLANAHLLLLPLTFATANNALLEAYSVGTQVLVSDILGVKDYLISTSKTFRNINEAFILIENMCSKEIEDINRIKIQTLQEGKKFHWKQIATLTSNFYMDLIQRIKV